MTTCKINIRLFLLVVLLHFLFGGTAVYGQQVKSSLIYTVHKPAKVTAKTPVLIILHGYGSRETDSREMAKTLSDRFLVFCLRAPHTTTVGGYCWFKMDFLPWAQFKNNYKEAEASKMKILSFISQACRAYHADSNQVYVMGFSQGGMMAYDIGLTAPKKIKGIVALSTRIMEETVLNPTIDWPQAQKVKYLIIGGYSDKVISFLDSYKAHDFLKTKGIYDLAIKFHDIPHTIIPEEITEIKGWLQHKIDLAAK